MVPNGGVLGIAVLQEHQLVAGNVAQFRLLDFEGAAVFVELIEGDEGIFAQLGQVDAVALDLHDQGAEVGAPVADVVVADQVGSTEVEQAGDGLADHHWAQVADVCLLGGISTRVVDDDFATVLEGFSAALVVLFGGERELPLPNELRREREIDEARASDVERDERRVEFVGGFCSAKSGG